MAIQGPNVRKLIIHKMSILAIPPGPGSGLAAGIALFTTPGKLGGVAKQATEWVEATIAAVRAAPDNPHETDEEIAGAILAAIEERKGGR